MYRQLVYKALKTPDGTVLQSKTRWDFNSHIDKNGKFYSIDGGLNNIFTCSKNDDGELIFVFADEPIGKVRNYFSWGARDNKNVIYWILLKDITDSHLDNLCSYQVAPKWARLLFIAEKQLRNELY